MTGSRRSFRLCCVFCALLAGALALMLSGDWLTGSARADEPATPAKKSLPDGHPGYSYRSDHDPNGTGKFYLGREIAQVMTFHGAPWLERPEREDEERLSLLVDSLKLTPGMAVADV